MGRTRVTYGLIVWAGLAGFYLLCAGHPSMADTFATLPAVIAVPCMARLPRRVVLASLLAILACGIGMAVALAAA